MASKSATKGVQEIIKSLKALSEASTCCVTVTSPPEAVQGNAASAIATKNQLIQQADFLFDIIQAKASPAIAIDIAETLRNQARRVAAAVAELTDAALEEPSDNTRVSDSAINVADEIQDLRKTLVLALQPLCRRKIRAINKKIPVIVEYFETFSFDECQKNPGLSEILQRTSEVGESFGAMYPDEANILTQAQVGTEIFELIKTSRRHIGALPSDDLKSVALQSLTKFTKAASILNDAERQVVDNANNISAMLQLVVSAKFLIPTLADVLGIMFNNRIPPEVLNQSSGSTRLSEVAPARFVEDVGSPLVRSKTQDYDSRPSNELQRTRSQDGLGRSQDFTSLKTMDPSLRTRPSLESRGATAESPVFEVGSPGTRTPDQTRRPSLSTDSPDSGRPSIDSYPTPSRISNEAERPLSPSPNLRPSSPAPSPIATPTPIQNPNPNPTPNSPVQTPTPGSPAAKKADAAPAPDTNSPEVEAMAKIDIWDEQETETNCTWFEENGVKKLKAATLNVLINKLTSADAPDMKFTKAFLTTYQSFVIPDTFFMKLVQRYRMGYGDANDGQPQKVIPPIQLRIVNVLKMWIETRTADFDPILAKKLVMFIQHIAKDGDKHAGMAQQLSASTKKYFTFLKQQKSQPEEAIPLAPAAKAMAFETLLTLSEKDVALHLTKMEFDIFQKIQPKELLNKAWSNPKLKHRSPNVLAMVERFNTISHWVAYTILSQKAYADRVRAFEMFIRICMICYEINSFNTAMALLSGFENAAVHRLNFTKEGLGQSEAEKLEFLSPALSSAKSYKLYRDHMHNVNPPLMPYLGVYLTDITFIEDGNNDFLENNGTILINFRKRELVFTVIQEIQDYQLLPFDVTLQPDIVKVLANPPTATDDELWATSLQREPRNANRDDIIPPTFRRKGDSKSMLRSGSMDKRKFMTTLKKKLKE